MPLSPRRILKVPPQALYFDGVDDCVIINPFNPSDTVNTFPLTVMMTIFYNAISGKTMTYISNWSGGFTGWFIQKTSDNKFLIAVGTGSSFIIAGKTMTSNQWLNVAGVINNVGSDVKLYINASLIDSNTLPSYSPGYNYITIGCHPTRSHYILGYVSQVLIYSRVLSSDEIAWNYEYPDNPVRRGLVLWLSWDSIDINAGIWYDKSGYGNHGTIYGATLVQIIKKPSRILKSARIQSPVR